MLSNKWPCVPLICDLSLLNLHESLAHNIGSTQKAGTQTFLILLYHEKLKELREASFLRLATKEKMWRR